MLEIFFREENRWEIEFILKESIMLPLEGVVSFRELL